MHWVQISPAWAPTVDLRESLSALHSTLYYDSRESLWPDFSAFDVEDSKAVKARVTWFLLKHDMANNIPPFETISFTLRTMPFSPDSCFLSVKHLYISKLLPESDVLLSSLHNLNPFLISPAEICWYLSEIFLVQSSNICLTFSYTPWTSLSSRDNLASFESEVHGKRSFMSGLANGTHLAWAKWALFLFKRSFTILSGSCISSQPLSAQTS